MGPFRKACFAIASLIVIGCSSENEASRNTNQLASWAKCTDKLRVCATTPLIADMVKRVGGDAVAVISLMGSEIDPHSYEIVKGDAEKLSYASIVFANGLSLEHSKSMKRALETHPNTVYVSQAIAKQEIIYVGGSPDPHIWMDMDLWAMTTDPIAKALAKLDPKNQEGYENRARAVRDSFKRESQSIQKKLQKIPVAKRRLVTSHDAFNYFAKRYLEVNGDWKSRVIAIQGLSPEEQISPLEIKRVVEYVRKYDVDVIFAETNLSRDSLHKVVDACLRLGQSVRLAKEELYGDTLGTKSYLEMMEHNARVIEENLTRSVYDRGA